MSTLWTPGGERPVSREPRPGSGPEAAPSAREGAGEPTPEEMQARLAELQEQLARTPAEVVVANHAFGLFELAALHLSLQPPQLDQARLAIDALASLVDGLGDRLGDRPGAGGGPGETAHGLRADPRGQPVRRRASTGGRDFLARQRGHRQQVRGLPVRAIRCHRAHPRRGRNPHQGWASSARLRY